MASRALENGTEVWVSDVSAEVDEDEDSGKVLEKVWPAHVCKKLTPMQKPAGEKSDWYSLYFGAEPGDDNRYDYPIERIFQSELAAKLDMFCV